MKNFLILEDSHEQLLMLKNIISDVSEKICVYTASSINEAYSVAMEHNIDCFLVDIILDTSKAGDTSGIQFVTNIRNMNRYYLTPILFITSLEDPELFTYKELHCLDYIEKPYDVERIKSHIRRLLELSNKRDIGQISFRKDGIIHVFNHSEIVYIETTHHRLTLHLADGTEFVGQYQPCYEILKRLNSDVYIQCNRSTIVNRKYIKNIDFINKYIEMKNIEKNRVEIGVTFKKKIMEIYEG